MPPQSTSWPGAFGYFAPFDTHRWRPLWCVIWRWLPPSGWHEGADRDPRRNFALECPQVKMMQFQNRRIDVKLCAPNHIKTCLARHTVPKDIQKHMGFDTFAKRAKSGHEKNAPNVTHTVFSATTPSTTTTRANKTDED